MTGNPLQDDLNAAQTEGQGVWKVTLLPRSSLPAVLVAEGALAHSISGFFQNLADRPANNLILCLTCSAGFTSKQLPEALAIVAPDVPATTHRYVSGLCSQCFHLPDVHNRIRATLAAGWNVRMRAIDIHPAGTA